MELVRSISYRASKATLPDLTMYKTSDGDPISYITTILQPNSLTLAFGELSLIEQSRETFDFYDVPVANYMQLLKHRLILLLLLALEQRHCRIIVCFIYGKAFALSDSDDSALAFLFILQSCFANQGVWPSFRYLAPIYLYLHLAFVYDQHEVSFIALLYHYWGLKNENILVCLGSYSKVAIFYVTASNFSFSMSLKKETLLAR